jgi:AsmA protein
LIALTAVLVAIAAALNPWRLAEQTVERYLIGRLSAQLGVAVTGATDGVFALLPTPRVAANDVRVQVGDIADLRIPRIRAEISVLALLTGRLQFDTVTLVAPQIDIAVGHQGADAFGWLMSTVPASWPVTPRIVVRDNGSILLRNGDGVVSLLRDVNGQAGSRKAGAPWEFEGGATWRGEKFSVAFASNSPDRATLPLLNIKSAMANLDFRGQRRASAGSPPGAMEGQFTFTSPSLARATLWASGAQAVDVPLGATEISGRLVLGPDKADLRSAAVTIGADTLEGALAWQLREGRWRLNGTFAGRSLDVARPGSGVETQALASLDLNAALPFARGALLSHDLDLRLSIQRLRIGGVTLTDVAAQLMGSEQRIDLSVANAGLYRGAVRGRLTLERSASGMDARAQVAADKVDLGPLSVDLFELRRMTGIGAAQAQLEASGGSMAELTSSLHGRLTATARNGDFLGTNLTDAMRRIERQPLAVARDWRGGRTAFEQFTVAGVIAGGVLELSEGAASGVAYRLSLGGRVSLPEQIIRMSGAVQSTNAATVVPFEIIGPLGEPMVSVNPRALIERSGAVQPFLERRAP